MTKTAMRTLALSFLVAGLAVALAPRPAAAARSDAEKVERLIKRARKELSKGHYEKALDRFGEADELTGGSSAEILAGMADAHLGLGHFQEAIDAGDRLIEVAADDRQRAKAHNVVGLAFFGRGQQTASEAILTSLSAYEEEEAAAEALRDEAQRLQKAAEQEFLSSADAFRRVIELTGGSQATPWQNYAEALFRGNHHDEARVALDRLAAGLPEGQELPGQAAALLACLAALDPANDPPTHGLGDKASAKKIQPPVKIEAPQPQSTDLARHNGVRGTIVIRAIIDKEGRVVCPEILQGLPYGLNSAALDAILDWRFEPATLDGEPVQVYYNLTVSFSIQPL